KTRTTTPTTFPIDHKLQKLKKKVSTILKIKAKLLLFYSRVHKQQSSKPSKKPRLNNNSKFFCILDNDLNRKQLKKWLRKKPQLTNWMLQLKIISNSNKLELRQINTSKLKFSTLWNNTYAKLKDISKKIRKRIINCKREKDRKAIREYIINKNPKPLFRRLFKESLNPRLHSLIDEKDNIVNSDTELVKTLIN